MCGLQSFRLESVKWGYLSIFLCRAPFLKLVVPNVHRLRLRKTCLAFVYETVAFMSV